MTYSRSETDESIFRFKRQNSYRYRLFHRLGCADGKGSRQSGSEHRPQEATYWIVDKDFEFTRLGFHEELKKQTIGPLDSLQFYKKMKELNIDLKLKDSKK